VTTGEWPAADNPLANAPHTAEMVTADEWRHPYPRSLAGHHGGMHPGENDWSPVRRIDGAYGDRNLVCACPPPESFADHDFTAHEASGDGSVPVRGAGAPDDLGTTADVVGAQA